VYTEIDPSSTLVAFTSLVLAGNGPIEPSGDEF
jgi:hypothetical protein